MAMMKLAAVLTLAGLKVSSAQWTPPPPPYDGDYPPPPPDWNYPHPPSPPSPPPPYDGNYPPPPPDWNYPRPPSPPAPSRGRCPLLTGRGMDVVTNTRAVAAIQKLCCKGGGSGHRRALQSDRCVLSMCTKACARVFVPAMSKCKGTKIGRQLAGLKNAFNFNRSCKSRLSAPSPPPSAERCGGYMEGNALSPRCSCGASACHYGRGGWSCKCNGASGGNSLPPQVAAGRPFVVADLSPMMAAAVTDISSDWIGSL